MRKLISNLFGGGRSTPAPPPTPAPPTTPPPPMPIQQAPTEMPSAPTPALLKRIRLRKRPRLKLRKLLRLQLKEEPLNYRLRNQQLVA